MTAFPQYASTTDQGVLDAVRQNAAMYAAFHQRALIFSEAQGVEDGAYYANSFGSSRRLSALGGKEKPSTGQWTKHPRGGWRPFKNNPVSLEMDEVRIEFNPVPGLPFLVESALNGDFQRWMANSQPFEVDGVIYVGFNFLPADGGEKIAEGGWEEIKASEFHKAMETYNERLQSGS